MKIKKHKLIIFFSVIISFPIIINAQGPDISENINNFYKWSLGIGAIAAIIMVIVGAINITVSGGSSDRLNEGKDRITSAIWGLVILFGAFLILNTVNPQITDLTPPSGPVVQGQSCEANPELDPCGEGQSPYDADNNELVCCTTLHNIEGKGVNCSQEIYENESCSSSIQTIGSFDGPEPFCETGEPQCSIITPDSGSNFGGLSSFSCAGGSGEPKCEGGSITYCTEDENGNDVVKCSQDESNESLSILDCNESGDCSETIKIKEVEIKPGGAYKQILLFPSSKSPEEAQCINYAYKKDSSSSWKKSTFNGVGFCNPK